MYIPLPVSHPPRAWSQTIMASINDKKPAAKNRIDKILKNIRMELIIPPEYCFQFLRAFVWILGKRVVLKKSY